jgi:pimeloyl-ACP methyl ester carboxylesterase
MDRHKWASLVVAGSLVTGALAPAVSGASPVVIDRPPVVCRDSDPGVRQLRMEMRTGKNSTAIATGRYAVPEGRPKGLVLFDHGYGHTSASWVEHLKNTARRGFIGVAPDYRGIQIKPDSDDDGLPESRGWNVMKGAEDTVVAAQLFDAYCKSIKKIVVFGVSMGGNTAGLAVAMAKERRRQNGKPLFDYWVNVEGAVNVVETYMGARALAPVNEFAANAQEDIEKEMGGTFEESPQAYLDHAVVSHIADIKASGLKGVVTVHGVDDGLVPYNQAREISGLLTASQIPNDMFTVGRESKKTDDDTTATGYVGGQVDENYDSPLAGHASETSRVHIVMVTAFRQLWGLFQGKEPGPAREFLVDGEEGTVPTS